MRTVLKYLFGVLLLTAGWELFLFVRLRTCSWVHSDAPLRMLLIGDPQIESGVEWKGRTNIQRIVLWFNDWYMKLITDTLVEGLKPTHVAVMGDLFSFQGTTDYEFAERSNRYKVIFSAAINHSTIINVTGNHDLGYGEEVTTERIKRYEKDFGRSNFNVFAPLQKDLNKDTRPDVAVISVLNSLLLDPSKDFTERAAVWHFTGELQSVRREYAQEPLILITHIPLHKQTGCVDKPLIHLDEDGMVTRQNHLSQSTSRHILDYVAPDIILTGHDHHGCTYNHTNSHGKHIAEFTIRSIMGDFSGTGALLEVHPSLDDNWTHTFQYCHFAPLRLLTTALIIQVALVLFAFITCIATFINNRCRQTVPYTTVKS